MTIRRWIIFVLVVGMLGLLFFVANDGPKDYRSEMPSVLRLNHNNSTMKEGLLIELRSIDDAGCHVSVNGSERVIPHETGQDLLEKKVYGYCRTKLGEVFQVYALDHSP